MKRARICTTHIFCPARTVAFYSQAFIYHIYCNRSVSLTKKNVEFGWSLVTNTISMTAAIELRAQQSSVRQ